MYMFPCDEVGRPGAALQRPLTARQPEKDRMDIYHKLFSVARRDQLHQAPIPQHWEPRILDIGCGTGIWAIDMAE
jgi:2-polyprenyl-3-methyl-5-hydroxy-6-metoxy-1,4-benzoquinol methylase